MTEPLQKYQESGVTVAKDSFTGTAATIEPPSLADLRSNYDAAQQMAADVTERLKAARQPLEQRIEKAKARMTARWLQANQPLADEYVAITAQAASAEKALRDAVVAAWKARGDVKDRSVDKALKLSVKAPAKVGILAARNADAIAWVKANLRMALIEDIDRKLFDTAILGMMESERPGFVEIKYEPVAVIGKLEGK